MKLSTQDPEHGALTSPRPEILLYCNNALNGDRNDADRISTSFDADTHSCSNDLGLVTEGDMTTCLSSHPSSASTLTDGTDVITMPTATINELPCEILWNIMERLSARDLTALRSTAKKYAAAGRYLLCLNINVTETKDSLNRLILISEQDEEIRDHVKHLQFMPFDLDNGLSSAHFNNEVHDNALYVRRMERVSVPVRRAFEELVMDKLEFARMRAVEKALIFAMKQLKPSSCNISVQNLLRYRQESRPDFWEETTHEHYNHLRDLGVVDRDSFGDSLYDGPVMSRSFVMLLASVYNSKLVLKSLEASTGLAFSFVRGDMRASRLLMYTEALENLTELKLNISFDNSEAKYLDTPGDLFPPHSAFSSHAYQYSLTRKGRLGELLQGAVGLEKMELSIIERLYVRNPGEDFAWPGSLFLPEELDYLGGRTWPKLKSVKFSNFNCTVDGITAFVRRHATSLKHLVLEDIQFEDNDVDSPWPKLFNNIRQEAQDGNLALECFELRGAMTAGHWVIQHQSQLPLVRWIGAMPLDCTTALAKQVEMFVLGRSDHWKPSDD